MPEPVEGNAAKQDRQAREDLFKLFGNVSNQHSLIVILTDLTGKTPTRVHIQGPSADKVLLYGMLEVAKDVVQMSGTNPGENK